MRPTIVDDVMTHLVVTFRPDDKIKEAATKMLRNRISGGPVVVRGRIVGILSEADLVRAYAPPARRGSPLIAPTPLMFLLHDSAPVVDQRSRVGDVMTREPVGIPADMPLWEAAQLIDRHGFRRLPVIDSEGFVVGILTRSDIVRAMASNEEGPVTVPA